jgi:iron complex transport system ATP-binding protein
VGLSVDALAVTLGTRRVLDAVSATFAPGRVTAVLGSNGAGKSTLLRALAGLVTAQNGRALLDGVDIAAVPPRVRAQVIGYLPQDATVHWNMAVRDLVALGRLPHGGGGAEAIEAALATTDTSALADRPIGSLSGGERARVLLARVLAGEPRWLLADEPLASLDPRHQLQTLGLLRSAASGGMGVIVVLHDLTLAARVAHDVLILHDGRVLAHGPTAEHLTAENLRVAFGVAAALLDTPAGRVVVPVARA